MKTINSYSFINIVGSLWMPQTTAATTKTLSQYDIENMTNENGEIDRDAVELWLCTNSGDFSSVTDFYADIETDKGNVIIDWENEENEFVFNDCMYQD